ncbi:hypothetical protein ZIOFF_041371 [Zingiber officinale]|uniref:DNA 3'-5' helicase n=1 Tax=Zingiber officinale TaxID=94328 RepID=A0A8J5L5S2_ZINOF|nr:hypothetical protein ZIOFF_041371 [Zingiber officinale]
MIVAGPGSGKGIDPSNILAMTFTIAAASEMRDQIGIVAGKAVAKEIEISTFHSFCFQLAGNMQKSVESNPCCAPLWRKNFCANEDKANSSFPILFLFCLGSSSTCLEWDVVFIVKANDNEIPSLHEYNGVHQGATTLEERRLLYVVAMTRARKKLYIVYVIMDSSWQSEAVSRDLVISIKIISNSMGLETSDEKVHGDVKKIDDISRCFEGITDIALNNSLLKSYFYF